MADNNRNEKRNKKNHNRNKNKAQRESRRTGQIATNTSSSQREKEIKLQSNKNNKRILDLRGFSFTNSFLLEAGYPKVTCIYITDSKLTSIPEELKSLKESLVLLDFSQNSVSTLPLWLCEFKKLEIICAKSNLLQPSSFPCEFGKLKLRQLLIEGNPAYQVWSKFFELDITVLLDYIASGQHSDMFKKIGSTTKATPTILTSTTNGNQDCVIVWGRDGQNLEGTPQPRPLPNFFGKTIVQVGAGREHTVFLTDLGQLYSCGSNTFGQLGLGHTSNQDKPEWVSSLSSYRIIQVACGAFFSLVLTESGSVWSFGQGKEGQLGNGDTEFLIAPIMIEHKILSRIRIVQIAAGSFHALALTRDNKIFSWGKKGAWLGRSGTSERWNLKPGFAEIPSDIVVSQIEANLLNSYLLTHDEKIYECGLGNNSSVFIENKAFETFFVKKMVASGSRALFLIEDKTSKEWFLRASANNIKVRLNMNKPIIEIACSTNHFMYLTADGEVYNWGSNIFAQLGVEQRSDVINPIKVNNLPTQIFSVQCSHEMSIAVISVYKCILGEDLKCSFENQNDENGCFDIAFIFENGNKILAHKVIIWARCQAFFEQIIKTKEENENKITEILMEIDIKIENFINFLNFIYTDSITMNNLDIEMRRFLINFSEKYGLLSLRNILTNGSKKPTIENDLKKLLNNQIFTDIEFEIESKKIYAHKVILCQRSTYFKAKYQGAGKFMQESERNVSYPENATYDAFLALLGFIYTDKLEEGLDINIYLNLLELSNFYNILRLREMCSTIIAEFVDVETSAYVWKIADENGAIKLATICKHLFKSNQITAKSGEAWECLTQEQKKRLEI
eukprot:TRINITY_DN553_c0_g1_i1.p1 TRINITY_DN553_c0_g1~~TRINITY_DN553_c0_g1_i1.p1  ORF type:complete len:846 (-),score=248.58 TRINITY_DN553_c0_g1_i1:124-2661(-)